MQRKKYYTPKKREFKSTKSKYNVKISIIDDNSNTLEFKFSLIQESNNVVEFSTQLEKLINKYRRCKIKTILLNLSRFNNYSVYLQKCIDLEELVYKNVFKSQLDGFQKIVMY